MAVALTDADLVLHQTRLANAVAALDRIENGDQEASISHGNSASNSSISFTKADPIALRAKISRLQWEIENKCLQSFSHTPVTICN